MRRVGRILQTPGGAEQGRFSEGGANTNERILTIKQSTSTGKPSYFQEVPKFLEYLPRDLSTKKGGRLSGTARKFPFKRPSSSGRSALKTEETKQNNKDLIGEVSATSQSPSGGRSLLSYMEFRQYVKIILRSNAALRLENFRDPALPKLTQFISNFKDKHEHVGNSYTRFASGQKGRQEKFIIPRTLRKYYILLGNKEFLSSG